MHCMRIKDKFRSLLPEKMLVHLNCINVQGRECQRTRALHKYSCNSMKSEQAAPCPQDEVSKGRSVTAYRTQTDLAVLSGL